jgi:hypothetical protein
MLLSVLATVFLGCGSSASPNGGTAEISVNALSVTNVASVRLTVQSSSAQAAILRFAVMEKDNQYASVIHDLIPANDYSFEYSPLNHHFAFNV